MAYGDPINESAEKTSVPFHTDVLRLINAWLPEKNTPKKAGFKHQAYTFDLNQKGLIRSEQWRGQDLTHTLVKRSDVIGL